MASRHSPDIVSAELVNPTPTAKAAYGQQVKFDVTAKEGYYLRTQP